MNPGAGRAARMAPIAAGASQRNPGLAYDAHASMFAARLWWLWARKMLDVIALLKKEYYIIKIKKSKKKIL